MITMSLLINNDNNNALNESKIADELMNVWELKEKMAFELPKQVLHAVITLNNHYAIATGRLGNSCEAKKMFEKNLDWY